MIEAVFACLVRVNVRQVKWLTFIQVLTLSIYCLISLKPAHLVPLALHLGSEYYSDQQEHSDLCVL